MKKNKKIIIIISIVLLLVIGIISYFIYININGESKYLKIELNGKKEVTINYKEEYEDLGAKASYKSKDLTKDIKVDNNLDLEKVGTYTYIYKIKYKKQSKEIKRTIKVVDLERPEITLNGEKEISIYVGSNYLEKGATALDNYDLDLTEKIEIEGSVDTSKVGEYTIVYKVVDSSNNEASIERLVKVIEKSKETNNTNNNSNYTGVVGKTSKGYTIEQKNGIYYIDGIIIANKTYSLPSSYNPGDLLDVFLENFKKMQSDASNEGISLNVISGFRSYSYQKSIYNNYVARDGASAADRYSARAGHSEHQTGLAADINSLSQSFENTPEGQWLNNNCYKYGFIIRYVKGKEDETGYMFEPWHIRYVGVDLATKLYNNGNWITLEDYFGITSKY